MMNDCEYQVEGRHIPLLPAEILCRICSFMTLPALKCTRLSSKFLESCASTFLFETVYIDLLPESAEKLLSISACPKFALNVRTVHFESRVFRSYYGLDRFQLEYEERHKISNNRIPSELTFPKDAPKYEEISEDQWNKYYAAHMALYRSQQQDIIQSATIETVILHAFRRFPRLEDISLDRFRDLPLEDIAAAPQLLYSKTMTGTISKVLIPPDYEHVPRARHPLSLLNASADAGLKLKILHLANLDRKFFDISILKDNDRLRRCLASVRSLRLEIPLVPPNYTNGFDGWFGNLEAFINQCQSLVDLEIASVGGAFIDSSILRRSKWPNIRKVDLRQVIVAEDDLIDLIARHVDTLTDIVLHKFSLGGRVWGSIIRRLNRDIFPGCFNIWAEDEYVRYEEDRTPAFTLVRLCECCVGASLRRHPS